jgi:hypothetical protein
MPGHTRYARLHGAPHGPTEHDEEVVYTAWCQASYARWPELRKMYKIVNEGKRTYGHMAWLRSEGFLEGMPDRCLPVARKGFHAFYVELKRVKGGRLSDAQRARQAELRAEGNFVVTARGAERAIYWTARYLGEGTLPDPELEVGHEREGDGRGVPALEGDVGRSAGAARHR